MGSGRGSRTTRCPECGYEIEVAQDECPNCGAILGDYEDAEDFE